jgi:hypothetical protein
MKLRTIILVCLILLAFFAVLTYAQAPLNNNNTVVLNLGARVATDTITPISEVISSVNAVDVLTAKVQMMQDLAGIATGKMVIAAVVNGNPVIQLAPGTPVPDQALTAILTKWVKVIYDQNGNQIFP